MIILPLPARPDWRRPPIATLLLIVLCVAVFLIQGKDAQRMQAAQQYYLGSGLARQELPAYLQDLVARDKSDEAARLRQTLAQRKADPVQQAMDADADFMRRLHAGQVITPADAGYNEWRSRRTHYNGLLEQRVTPRYALQSEAPTPLTAVSHIFLHGSTEHLLGNMAFLFIVGYTVEAALGGWGMLALFLLGGLCATVPDLLFPQPGYGLGASGAVSAVMAAYLVLYGVRRIPFFYFFIFVFGVARWPALAILPVWVMKELLLRFVFDSESNINYLAHFAGFLGGTLLVALYRWRRGWRSADSVQREDAAESIAQLQAQAENHVAQLQFARATADYRRLIHALPEDAGSAEAYLRVARLAHQPQARSEAALHLLKLTAAHPRKVGCQAVEEALNDSHPRLPRLSSGAWGRILGRLLECQRLDTAEKLALRLAARPGDEAVAADALRRLADACRDAGDLSRARRLLTLRQTRLAHALTPAAAGEAH